MKIEYFKLHTSMGEIAAHNGRAQRLRTLGARARKFSVEEKAFEALCLKAAEELEAMGNAAKSAEDFVNEAKIEIDAIVAKQIPAMARMEEILARQKKGIPDAAEAVSARDELTASEGLLRHCSEEQKRITANMSDRINRSIDGRIFGQIAEAESTAGALVRTFVDPSIASELDRANRAGDYIRRVKGRELAFLAVEAVNKIGGAGDRRDEFREWLRNAFALERRK